MQLMHSQQHLLQNEYRIAPKLLLRTVVRRCESIESGVQKLTTSYDFCFYLIYKVYLYSKKIFPLVADRSQPTLFCSVGWLWSGLIECWSQPTEKESLLVGQSRRAVATNVIYSGKTQPLSATPNSCGNQKKGSTEVEANMKLKEKVTKTAPKSTVVEKASCAKGMVEDI